MFPASCLQLSYALQCGAKGWLYLNDEDSGIKSRVEGAGIRWACVKVDPKALDQALTDNIVVALDSLPRPTMVRATCWSLQSSTPTGQLRAKPPGGFPCSNSAPMPT